MSYFKIIAKGTVIERKIYYKDKECTIIHRENGPAVELLNGHKEYWLNNRLYKEDEYWTIIKFGGFI